MDKLQELEKELKEIRHKILECQVEVAYAEGKIKQLEKEAFEDGLEYN